MKVQFLMDVTWSDRSCVKGEVIELGDALAQKFIEKGFCKLKKDDKDEHSDKDGGSSESVDNGAGVDTPKRKQRRVNK